MKSLFINTTHNLSPRTCCGGTIVWHEMPQRVRHDREKKMRNELIRIGVRGQKYKKNEEPAIKNRWNRS